MLFRLQPHTSVSRWTPLIPWYSADATQFLPTWREAVHKGEPEAYHEANHLRRSLLAWLRSDHAVSCDVPLDAVRDVLSA